MKMSKMYADFPQNQTKAILYKHLGERAESDRHSAYNKLTYTWVYIYIFSQADRIIEKQLQMDKKRDSMHYESVSWLTDRL